MAEDPLPTLDALRDLATQLQSNTDPQDESYAQAIAASLPLLEKLLGFFKVHADNVGNNSDASALAAKANAFFSTSADAPPPPPIMDGPPPPPPPGPPPPLSGGGGGGGGGGSGVLAGLGSVKLKKAPPPGQTSSPNSLFPILFVFLFFFWCFLLPLSKVRFSLSQIDECVFLLLSSSLLSRFDENCALTKNNIQRKVEVEAVAAEVALQQLQLLPNQQIP
jgi:hypothetical protein